MNLLRACGINFSAVVSHYSEKNAAGYATGVLSAEETLSIAYYRDS